MAVSDADRAFHIKAAIRSLREGVGQRDLADLLQDGLDWAGFQHLLLVISEAAKNLSASWKAEFGPQIEWLQVANLGNLLRHAYHSVNAEVLWAIYENDLDTLETAIDAMLAAHASRSGFPSS